ncbi:uncharacterized protein LOC135467611 [Liolophura sinensis]|uniref:uncharacterized protein LOC135467611 n=1 Tax=Liolophura sinensis TaxID=3198878 RepID=UPI0031591C99
MMYLGFFLCLIAGAYAQRYVLPAAGIAKIDACRGYDFVTNAALPNGTTFIDRAFYIWGGRRMPCAPGTLFSLKRTSCVCDERDGSAVITIADRCITVTGNLQTDQQFSVNQRNALSTYNAWVNGYNNPVPTENSCFASNLDAFRCLPLMQGSSLGRSQLRLIVGFNMPAVQVGRQYTIVNNGGCLSGAGATITPSFIVNYVTGNPGQPGGVPHQMDVTVRFSPANIVGAAESVGTYTCQIPASITSTNGQNFVWDSNDSTNQFTLTVDLTGGAAFTFSVSNGATRASTGIPLGGFCGNGVSNFPQGVGRRGFVIASRDCPLCFGQAPVNSFMCMNAVNIVRDCT